MLSVPSPIPYKRQKSVLRGEGLDINEFLRKYVPLQTCTACRVAELTGHSERVLQLALSPDSTTLLSVGADETLRYAHARHSNRFGFSRKG